MNKKTARRQWTDEKKSEILAALDANQGNVKRTARQCGVAVSTLRGWAKGRGTNAGVAKLRPEKRGELADALEEIAWQIVELLPSKLQQAEVRELATLLGVSLDKLLLLRGQPNSRTEVSGVQIYIPDNERQSNQAA